MTVGRHKALVLRNCIKCGIIFQGIMHDMSKYSPEEFICGVKYFMGNRSPNEGEREAYGYSLAWMHHKGRNKHHFEYWTDYSPETKKLEPVAMPVKYVAEMFCDRVAASKIYMKQNYTDRAPLEYFLNGKKKRMIHYETSELIERLLTMLAEEGEEKTFKYIKELLKNKK